MNLDSQDMARIRDVIRQRADRLRDFPGQQPGKVTPEMIETADRIAEGTVFFNGHIPVAAHGFGRSGSGVLGTERQPRYVGRHRLRPAYGFAPAGAEGFGAGGAMVWIGVSSDVPASTRRTET